MSGRDTEHAAPETIRRLLERRCGPLLMLCAHVSASGERLPYTRPLAGRLLALSSSMEELLDQYGARSNRDWFRFRELVSALKNCNRVGYTLLHVYHRVHAYHLGDEAGPFAARTLESLASITAFVRRACRALFNEGAKLCLDIPTDVVADADLREELPLGSLPHDRGESLRARDDHGEADGEMVARLASDLLNLGGEFRRLDIPDNATSEMLAEYVRDRVHEEDLRLMELRAHNLQSMYDTYIQATAAEELDRDLVTLRGHITVVFHLLEGCTILSHYYQRHICARRRGENVFAGIIDDYAWLRVLVLYGLRSARLFLDNGADICRQVLKRYVRVESRSIPIPHYRGFHVRPSTLVAQIALHYGSGLEMELEGETYDASSPLELFRANEALNRIKRSRLAEDVRELADRPDLGGDEEPRRALRQILLALAERGAVVIYDTLDLDEDEPGDRTLLEYATDTIAGLLATGKIDIVTDVEAVFTGDARVLDDLAVLAADGYGEDRMGHNIPLPKELSYLHR